MSTKQIEIFSAGCPACQETIDLVNDIACGGCTIEVLDMNDPAVARRATGLGVRAVPAVAIDGQLASCCAARGVDEVALRAAGVGQAVG